MFLEEVGSSVRNARIIKHYCIIFHYDNIITPGLLPGMDQISPLSQARSSHFLEFLLGGQIQQ